MKIINDPGELSTAGRKVSLAIGVFDGVHLGHQQVIRQTITDAQQHNGIPVVVTFDRHPSTIVAPERAVPLIYPLSQRLRAISLLGVEATLLIRFDRAFSEQSAEEFIKKLVLGFSQIYSISVGSNFVFGHKRSGNVSLLKTLGHEFRFIVHGLAALALDGKTVSSTRIRDAIRQGNFGAASQMLGRAYSISGTVTQGDQLGRKLGFPTANLDVAHLVLPPTGVYAVRAKLGQQNHAAVLNLGYRPTINNPVPQLRTEAHLLDFDGDLYGKELEITFFSKLRDEQRFPSLEALKKQISVDVEQARSFFA